MAIQGHPHACGVLQHEVAAADPRRDRIYLAHRGSRHPSQISTSISTGPLAAARRLNVRSEKYERAPATSETAYRAITAASSIDRPYARVALKTRHVMLRGSGDAGRRAPRNAMFRRDVDKLHGS
jgi:hypothetical protein